jgi:flagellar biosynthesis/type III secretory pathway protein FliH
MSQESAVIEDWLAEARKEASEKAHKQGRVEGLAEGREEGLAEGREEGLAEGATLGWRRALLRYIETRLHTVPERMAARIASADAEWCERMLSRLLVVKTPEELEAAFALEADRGSGDVE